MSLLSAEKLKEFFEMPEKFGEEVCDFSELLCSKIAAARETVAEITAKIKALEVLAQQAEVIINTKQGS